MKLFGTDGIRGLANQFPMTVDIVMRTAMAATEVLGRHPKLVVIGKDTRLSGYSFEPALVAGFTARGIDVVLLGVLPTPAVAALTASLRADMGVMISASHTTPSLTMESRFLTQRASSSQTPRRPRSKPW